MQSSNKEICSPAFHSVRFLIRKDKRSLVFTATMQLPHCSDRVLIIQFRVRIALPNQLNHLDLLLARRKGSGVQSREQSAVGVFRAGGFDLERVVSLVASFRPGAGVKRLTHLHGPVLVGERNALVTRVGGEKDQDAVWVGDLCVVFR